LIAFEEMMNMKKEKEWIKMFKGNKEIKNKWKSDPKYRKRMLKKKKRRPGSKSKNSKKRIKRKTIIKKTKRGGSYYKRRNKKSPQRKIREYRKSASPLRHSIRSFRRSQKGFQGINEGISPNDFEKIDGGENLTWGQQLNIMKAAIDPNTTQRHQRVSLSPQRTSVKRVSFRPKNGKIRSRASLSPQREGKFRTYNTHTLPYTEDIEINDKIRHKLFEFEPHENRPIHPYAGLYQENIKKEPNMTQLSMLETHLSKIRNDLKPLMDRFNRHLPEGKSPHAELMELCTGRLMKVHSENLIEMVIDDLLMEMVGCLNQSEKQRKVNFKNQEIKDLCMKMMNDLQEIDIDQRHEFLGFKNGGINTQTLISSTKNDRNEYLKNQKIGEIPMVNLDYIEYLKEDVKIGGKMDGPYQNRAGLLNPYENFVTIDTGILMKLIRDQIMREDRLKEIPHFKKSYVEGVKVVSDQILDDVMEEILNDFSKVQDEFVNEVIKSEFT